MIERIKIKGFKRLLDVDFPLRPLNVLIGPNGVGKTSILETLSLLSAAVHGKLAESITDGGGFVSFATKLSASPELSVGVEFIPKINPNDLWQYQLSLAAQGYFYKIKTESAHTLKTDISDYLLESEINGTIIPSQQFLYVMNNPNPETEIAKSRNSYAEEFRGALTVEKYFSPLFGQQGRAKEAQQLVPVKSPGAKGEHLLSCLYTMREQRADAFEELLFVLKTAFPLFEKLTLPLVANGTVGLSWHEKGLDDSLAAYQLSEGTMRFLWLTAALMDPEPAALTFIDEPETSLHPELLRYLVDLMRDASTRTQLIVATHSDRLVRFLEPSEVAIMDRDENGFASIRRAEDMDIDGWLEDYSLDQLWQMGRLGGRS